MVSQLAEIMRAAGELSLRHFGRLQASQIEFKHETDLVTAADRDVELFLLERLRELAPDAGFMGEEKSGGDRPLGDRYFVVDPIDGTTSFVHGLPYYSVSVAYKEHGETVLGMVHLPCFGDTYHAEPGKGAWKNGKTRLQVSTSDRLIDALGATGFACVRARLKPDNLPIFSEAIYRIRGIRRLGSAAIDLCYVAEGKFDLYWEINIQPWDIAAGALIVTEAGGTVSDLDGGPGQEARRQILATNGHLHTDFLDLIRTARGFGGKP